MPFVQHTTRVELRADFGGKKKKKKMAAGFLRNIGGGDAVVVGRRDKWETIRPALFGLMHRGKLKKNVPAGLGMHGLSDVCVGGGWTRVQADVCAPLLLLFFSSTL